MNEIVERARFYLQTPFLHQGRNVNGIDCVGLCAAALQYDFDLIENYPRDPVNGRLEAKLEEILGAPVASVDVKFSDLREGDIVAMAYYAPIRHVGIIGTYALDEKEFSLIHTDAMVGKVTEHRLDIKWLRRIKRVYRYGG